MTEPIKLPPDLLAFTLVREGVNKHRARDIEQWMNEKMALAVEQATAELRAEVERLRETARDRGNRVIRKDKAIDALKDRNNGLKELIRTHRAEVERLRADAERYRWLRECARATSEHWGGRWSLVIEGPAPETATPAGIDAAIDAARNALKEPK